jgi:hypothetical protein
VAEPGQTTRLARFHLHDGRALTRRCQLSRLSKRTATSATSVENMKEEAPPKEHWKLEPEDHDFQAALDYLTLVLTSDEAADIVARLRRAPRIERKAKDLLRASGLALLDADNAHVAADLGKVKSGQHLSPVLLVRGDVDAGRPLIVADGYHRICASYHLNENAAIPCFITDL